MEVVKILLENSSIRSNKNDVAMMTGLLTLIFIEMSLS